MTGVLLGTAILVSAAGISPAHVIRPSAAPAASISRLPDQATLQRWARETPPRRQTTTTTKTRRHNTTDRIIAVAAGATVGFFGGGLIGGKITDRSKENPDDDTSVLKGVFIGAPIGAIVGAAVGWHLTKN